MGLVLDTWEYLLQTHNLFGIVDNYKLIQMVVTFKTGFVLQSCTCLYYTINW